ncbi:MAG: DUF554 domain-containing protein [Selenomonadaceae bacterium]|nr:DUF554 domain-containing protein [Selenomonadaceae bacterium]
MAGIGTIINTGCIIVGGLCGVLFGNLLKEHHQETLIMASGVSVLFIGIAGTMPYMLDIAGKGVVGGGTLLMVGCLSLGGLLGEILAIERRIEEFGEWLKAKTGNAKDNNFVRGFVTASLTVCIGAMAIVGAIQDGMTGDWSILAAKSILDLIIIMVMTCAMGKGCMFSAIPVFLFEGAITFLAVLVEPFMTETALNYISFIGSILIFCVGVNLVWNRGIRVANMLPSLALAIMAALLPVEF